MATSFTFIGFGEAAQHISRGLKASGAGPLRTYDILFDAAGSAGDHLRERAAETGVVACATSPEAVAGSDVVVSAVTASSALDAARAAAPGLVRGQFYVDINSVSPAAKAQVAAAVSPSGARFVEVAVMESVPPHGHRVPMLLAGAEAAALVDLLRPLGMRVEAVGPRIGQASSVKLLRSILIKGLESLMLESLYVASNLGVADRVLASLGETYPTMEWPKVADYLIGRTALHGARREAEMREAARMLRDVGFEPVMADAIANRIGWCAATLRGQRWDGLPTAEDVFAALNDRVPHRPA
jgi:3-hydroxyisobutyrate dehydrogenase-like beta-hydroxyacid dehydrogenase